MNWIALAVFVLLSMNLALPKKHDKKIEEFEKEYEITTSDMHRTCDEACKEISMFCNFDAYPNLTKTQIETLVTNANIENKNGTKCTNKNIDWPYPYVLDNERCIHHFQSNAWRATPACKVAAPFVHVELICFCRRQFDFNMKNKIIVGEAQQTCNETCNKIDSNCDFEDYGKLTIATLNNLLHKAVGESKWLEFFDECAVRNKTFPHLNTLFTSDPVASMQQDSLPPGFNVTTGCIFGFIRDQKKSPDCNKTAEDANVKLLCTCKKPNKFKKTNQLVLGKVKKSCVDACSDISLECNFEKYTELTQDEVVELLDETLRSAIDIFKNSRCNEVGNEGTTSYFTTNKRFTTENATNAPSFNEENECISGFVRHGRPSKLNCNTVMPSSEEEPTRRFCSCTNRRTTTASISSVETTTSIKPTAKPTTTVSETMKPGSSVSPSMNSTEDAARQARINKKYVAAAVTKMYILAAVMVIVEVILLGFLVREIRRNRALDKKEEEERKSREAERRRNSKAKTPKRLKRYGRNQRKRRS